MYGTNIIRTAVTNENNMFAIRSCISLTDGLLDAVLLLSITVGLVMIVSFTDASVTRSGLIEGCVVLGDTSHFSLVSVLSNLNHRYHHHHHHHHYRHHQQQQQHHHYHHHHHHCYQYHDHLFNNHYHTYSLIFSAPGYRSIADSSIVRCLFDGFAWYLSKGSDNVISSADHRKEQKPYTHDNERYWIMMITVRREIISVQCEILFIQRLIFPK